MKQNVSWGLVCWLLLTSVQAQIFPQLGAQRAGISALAPLKLEVSPRAAALASANVCLTGDGYAAYTNPATLDEIGGFNLALAHTFWGADVNYAFLSASQQFRVGTFAFSLGGLNSGPMEVRTTFQPDGTGELFYALYLNAALSYSSKLTDQFSWGATARVIHERLAEFTATTALVDLGFLYETDFKELRFAVLLQNFGPNSVLRGERAVDTTFNPQAINPDVYPAPTVFKLGVSMVPYRSTDEQHVITTLVQLNHPNDNAENLRLGVEYAYRKLLFLRAGYKINVKDQRFPTAGLGLRMRVGRYPLMLDYAFDPLEFLGVVHRVGLSFQVQPIEDPR